MAASGDAARGGYDEVSKAAVAAAIVEVLCLLGLGVPAGPLEPLEALPVDLPATVHRADLLFRTSGGQIIHVEIQHRPDPGMGRRMTEYGVRLAGAYPDRRGRGAAIQIVVQATGPPMPTRWEWAGLSTVYHLLHIPTMDVGSLLATPALSPFALISGGAAVVPEVVAHLAAVSDRALQSSLITLALRLAPTLARTIVEQLRRDPMSTEIIVDQLMATDIGTIIREQGIEQGIERGIERGVTAERRTAVLAILRHRFAGAEPDLLARTADRLISATPGVPDAALDGAFAVTTLDD